MNYILVADGNNKVLIFKEENIDLLNRFLKDNSMEIDNDNYFNEEEFERFNLYRHTANSDKTDEEFEEYKAMSGRIGLSTPERSSTIRPLHEYSITSYKDEKGNWRMRKKSL